jgi:hypothetical protein
MSQRILDGISLGSIVSPAAASVRASSFSHLPGQVDYHRIASDACDGSVFTYWLSEAPETGTREEWIEMALPVAVDTKVIRVVWRSGFESEIIETRMGADAATLAPVSVEWTPFPPPAPYTQSWVEGRLPRMQAVAALRLAFSGGPVGVTEILLGEPPETSPPTGGAGELWMCIAPDEYPSLAVDAHPVQARLLSWICHGHGAGGLVCYGLNQWPEAWRVHKDEPPMVWEADDPGRLFLYYPGPKGLLSSVRSEALRDGLEDYELLKAVSDRLTSGERFRNDAALYAARRYYSADVAPTELDGYVRMIVEGRVKLGLALSQDNPGDVK